MFLFRQLWRQQDVSQWEKTWKQVAYHSYPDHEEWPEFFQGVPKSPDNLWCQSQTFAPVRYVVAQDVVKEPILEHQAFARKKKFHPEIQKLILVTLEFSHLLIAFTARNVVGEWMTYHVRSHSLHTYLEKYAVLWGPKQCSDDDPPASSPPILSGRERIRWTMHDRRRCAQIQEMALLLGYKCENWVEPWQGVFQLFQRWDPGYWLLYARWPYVAVDQQRLLNGRELMFQGNATHNRLNKMHQV